MKQITDIHCSALSRPMTCLGSLFFEGLDKPETNAAAKEGTAAGEYLELLLTSGPPTATHAKNGVEFDEEIKLYTGEIANQIKTIAQSPILCEQPIDWRTRSGIWIKGKYDASFISEGKLYIDDLKYGWNIVDPHENWQLLGYAIGEVLRRGQAFDHIVLRIHQPRPHHEDGPTRTWEISYEQLLEYKEQIEARMDELSSGVRSLVTSSKCKYCEGTAKACTAFNRAFYASVDFVMSDFKQDNLSDAEIAQQLDLLSRVTDILKIKSGSIEQLAVSRIKNGALLPNYSIEESFGDRKWKQEVSPLVIKTLTGIDIMEHKMMSPAKAEKMGVPKPLVKGFVDRFFLGQKLVKKDTSKLATKIFGSAKE